MAKKNPYLSKPKEGISAQQKALRQHPGQDVNPPPLSKRLEADDEDDFPSIDGETVETQDGLRERKYKSKFDYFNNDAEESLRFFKKNLLPPSTSASAQVEASPLSPARQSRSTGLQQKPTGSPLESQPSMGSTRGELAHFARLHSPAATSATTRASVMTTNLNNNDYKSAPFRDSSKSELRSSRYKPTLQSPSDGESNAESIQARTRAATTAPSRVGADNPANANQNLPNQSLKSRPRIAGERQQSAPRHLSGDSKAADQVELAKPIKTSNSKISESPVPPEAFARKPLYNSLLRAHDSIRLKVNRPKVRPKSETAQVEDTEVDDSIKLPEMVDAPDQLNERAVDVKRRSSRKKNTKKEVKADKKAADDSMAPVRNFSEVRVVKVVRTDTERSLGVTVRAEDGNIIVARILAGSLADKQGALQVGDVILAVNDREVYTPEQLQEQLRKSSQEDIVLLKIVPSFREELPTLCIYLRALFNHDPNEDSLLPCKEVGVSFNQGDILEVVNQEDPNWWQARRVDSENLQTGLIPSQELEERRRAFVIPDYDLATRTSICGTKVSRKSKKKEIYNVGQNCDFDRAELQLYEEVCRTPAFERRTLVLIGANGVGKQALKAKLIALDPDRFGTPLPHTSRLARDGEEDGIHYLFVTREKMEEDIMAGKYLEYGEYDGALYGTKLDSVREIIGSGKVCVLDCSPTCLKVLKTSDYLPFVAFIAAPTLDQLRYMHDWNRGNKTYATFDRALSRQSRRAKTLQDFAFDFFEDEDLQVTIEESARLFRIYENYFDIVLVNNDFNRTFEALRDAIDALSMAPQWIPISWIYGT